MNVNLRIFYVPSLILYHNRTWLQGLPIQHPFCSIQLLPVCCVLNLAFPKTTSEQHVANGSKKKKKIDIH